MKKHPSAFKLGGYLVEKNKNVVDEAVVLYDGKLCLLYRCIRFNH